MRKQAWTNHINNSQDGLVEIKPPILRSKYNETEGFNIGMSYKVYELTKVRDGYEGHIEQPGVHIETLVRIKDDKNKSQSDPVFIMEVEKGKLVHCQLILKKEAFKRTLGDANQHILRIHQMYPRIWEDFMKRAAPPKKPLIIMIHEFKYQLISVFIPKLKTIIKKLSESKN